MDSPVKIAASILAADFARLGDAVSAMERAGADAIHIDVMDGHFVPNITIGPAVISALRPCTTLPFDVHLMIAPVESHIAAFAEAGATSITIHPEAGPHAHRSIQMIRDAGCRAGLALNPATPAEQIDPVLADLDLVLVMSVNPGFGGQTFIKSQLEKISLLRKRIDAAGRAIELQVDGGITPDTAGPVRRAGGDVLIAGTAAFRGGPDSYAGNIAALRGG